MSFIQAASQF
jgi:uncharacterized protein (DUF2252 family)